ncbi:hypothetical protein ABZS63_34940, partial [Streptomyces sp. NPDC005568]
QTGHSVIPRYDSGYSVGFRHCTHSANGGPPVPTAAGRPRRSRGRSVNPLVPPLAGDTGT